MDKTKEDKKFIKVCGIEERCDSYRISIYDNNGQIKFSIPHPYIVSNKNKPIIFALRTLLQFYVDSHIIEPTKINTKLLLNILNGKILYSASINNQIPVNISKESDLILHNIDTKIETQLKNKLVIYSKRIDNQSHDPNKIKESTYSKYKTSINNELIPNFGNFKLQDLTKLKVLEWIDNLNITFKTFRDYIIPLKSIYLDAIAVKIIPDSANIFNDNFIIIRAAEVLPNGMKEINPLSWDDIIKIQNAPDGYMKLLILTACFTGVRPAELINIRRKNIDFKNGTIRIIDQYNGKNETACKSKDSERDVKILGILENVIIKQLSLCSEYEQSEFLFFNPNTRQRFSSSTKLNQHVTKYLLSLGIQRRTCHEFRHTYATIMLQTEDIQWVAGQMGHATIELLISTYSHILKSKSKIEGYKVKNLELYASGKLIFSKGNNM